jgi:thioredoxin-like negative regulator of GroEL
VRPLPPRRSRSGPRRRGDGGARRRPKVDTEAWPDLAARFRVQSIPTFVVLSGGRVVVQQPGLVSSAQLVAWLDGAA